MTNYVLFGLICIFAIGGTVTNMRVSTDKKAAKLFENGSFLCLYFVFLGIFWIGVTAGPEGLSTICISMVLSAVNFIVQIGCCFWYRPIPEKPPVTVTFLE